MKDNEGCLFNQSFVLSFKMRIGLLSLIGQA